jgi:hypothetical protein
VGVVRKRLLSDVDVLGLHGGAGYRAVSLSTGIS